MPNSQPAAYASGIDKTVRIAQITSIWPSVSGIRAARMHGMDADRNRIEDTETEPTTYRTAKS